MSSRHLTVIEFLEICVCRVRAQIVIYLLDVSTLDLEGWAVVDKSDKVYSSRRVAYIIVLYFILV